MIQSPPHMPLYPSFVIMIPNGAEDIMSIRPIYCTLTTHMYKPIPLNGHWFSKNMASFLILAMFYSNVYWMGILFYKSHVSQISNVTANFCVLSIRCSLRNNVLWIQIDCQSLKLVNTCFSWTYTYQAVALSNRAFVLHERYTHTLLTTLCGIKWLYKTWYV